LRIVFAVCHPDDEALWTGATITGLSAGIADCHVVCLTGASSERAPEFEAARAVAGYASGTLLDAPLGPASTPLPAVGPALEQGLAQLGLEHVDLLVTHSPYGDEHRHPHHVQAHRELSAWSAERDVPFACFAQLPLPFVSHRPRLRAIARSDALQVLELASCHGVLAPLRLRLAGIRRPRLWVRFEGDLERKQRMLEQYRSIDLAEHARAYAAYASAAEGFYAFDAPAAAALTRIVETLTGDDDLFATLFPRGGLLARLSRA
jgi:LmbE family N-acetylglucosaminyl deacetylase